MALLSPGLQVTVSDESQYVPGAVGTVPLVVLATVQDKLTPSGGIAAGTSKALAGALQSFTSQRELISAFGYPEFIKTAAGTPVHAHERSEYGLMAAYSALGVGNKLYAVRADIDLSQLEGTSVRPVGSVTDGTYWFNLTSTAWGIYEWNESSQTFAAKDPVRIISAGDLDLNTVKPADSVGNIGSYAVVVRSLSQTVPYTPKSSEMTNNLWYKNSANTWVAVNSAAWQQSWPAATGLVSNPVISAVTGPAFSINGQGITLSAGTTTVQGVAQDINSAAIAGVTAAVASGKLAIYVTGAALNSAAVLLDLGQDTLAELGLDMGAYAAPTVSADTYINVPAWRSSDSIPRPSGSVYLKTTALGNGANFIFKKYSQANKNWGTTLAAPLYQNEFDALYNLDPAGGGSGLTFGTVYVRYSVSSAGVNFKPYYRAVQGATKVTGNIPNSAFVPGNQLRIEISQPNTATTLSYTVTVTGTTTVDFVKNLLAANIPNLTVVIESSGAVTLGHRLGGTVALSNVAGSPLTTAGFTNSTPGVTAINSTLYVSNWQPLSYVYGYTEPYQAPETGKLWYYNSVTDADIMVNDGAGWKGYRTVANDARGYNLTQTDPAGPIISPTRPVLQSDNTELVAGDLWIDSSEEALQNHPKIYRYSGSAWVAVDNTDRISQNGILFADARWDANVDGGGNSVGGLVDPVTGAYPAIANMLLSSYVDLDAPDHRLYPRGSLLFNTRRSGSNVKRYVNDHFNDQAYPNKPLPAIKATWVTASGNKEDGSPFAGPQAVRNMVVKAMKGALDTNSEVREDRIEFNLIATPGYPELIPNMLQLNNDRANTAFIIGDTPMRLVPSATAINRWSNNIDGGGLANNDPYLGVFYPSARTNDLSGNTIVVPPSHVMLRAFIRNDNVSYQWFAPAGTRRGLIDNASDVGFVDPRTGAFAVNSINQGLRDSLYQTKINPITSLPGIGLVNWGQKTRNPTASSLDRINVARLVNYIRTILATVGNGFLFEPNDKQTRDQIKQIIEGAMNDLVAKRGITDYLVVCDETNNTSDRIARNELYVDIAIEPMRSVEFIYIPIRLKSPGAIAGGV